MRRGRLSKICAKMPMIAFGLMGMCPTGCATSSQGCIQPPVVIEITPPEELMQPCRPPKAGSIETNGELLELLMATADAFSKCAAKVEAIREFYKKE